MLGSAARAAPAGAARAGGGTARGSVRRGRWLGRRTARGRRRSGWTAPAATRHAGCGRARCSGRRPGAALALAAAGLGGASAAVRLARPVAAFSRPVWPVARGGFGEACGRDTRWRQRSAWGGREEEQMRKDDKGNREVRLTSRQPCSGMPRVADGVDDWLAVRPRAPSARTHSQRFD